MVTAFLEFVHRIILRKRHKISENGLAYIDWKQLVLSVGA